MVIPSRTWFLFSKAIHIDLRGSRFWYDSYFMLQCLIRKKLEFHVWAKIQKFKMKKKAEKLKSCEMKDGCWKMNDESWKMKVERWRKNVERWRFKVVGGFEDRQTDEQTFVIVELLLRLKIFERHTIKCRIKSRLRQMQLFQFQSCNFCKYVLIAYIYYKLGRNMCKSFDMTWQLLISS